MTVSEFLDLVRRTQLVEEDQLTKFLGALAARNGRKLPEAPDKVSAEMVSGGLLTEWQSEKLLHGKWKGFLLDKYLLLDYIGRREHCQTYLAMHLRMRRLVELWVAPTNRVIDSSWRDRLREDARETALSKGISILEDYNYSVDGHCTYIVMEHKAS